MAAITDEDAKELISKCIVGLHCASGRLNLSGAMFDRQSCDIQIDYERDAAPDNELATSHLRIQVKATSHPVFLQNGILSFQLKSKNYNDLRRRNNCRNILVVAVLEEEVDNCIVYGNDVTARVKLLYQEISGMPGTENDSVAIRIPPENVFDSRKALEMLDEVCRQVWMP